MLIRVILRAALPGKWWLLQRIPPMWWVHLLYSNKNILYSQLQIRYYIITLTRIVINISMKKIFTPKIVFLYTLMYIGITIVSSCAKIPGHSLVPTGTTGSTGTTAS